jgi:hypothetical protein
MVKYLVYWLTKLSSSGQRIITLAVTNFLNGFMSKQCGILLIIVNYNLTCCDNEIDSQSDDEMLKLSIVVKMACAWWQVSSLWCAWIKIMRTLISPKLV